MKLLKFVLAGLLAFGSFGFSQERVVYPKNFGSKVILGADGFLKQITTSDTTDAVSLSNYRGAVTLFFIPDTVGNTPVMDSCLTITPLLKNKGADIWTVYGGPAVVDTLDRDIIAKKYQTGKTYANGAYYPIALSNAWAVADSVKFAIGIGVGDKLELMVIIQGQ